MIIYWIYYVSIIIMVIPDKLDTLINDLHMYVYGDPSTQTMFKVVPINPSSLDLARFKMTDYDLDQVFSKIKYVNKFDLTDKGSLQYVFVRKSNFNSNIRITLYGKEDPARMTAPTNVNKIIRTLLSELVITGKTKSILLPIINIDIEGSDLKAYPRITEVLGETKAKDVVSVEITEKFYSMNTLDKYLTDTLTGTDSDSNLILDVIKQAVDVLYQINRTYPGFRHNQFVPQFIDCYLKADNKIELKLGNFYLSEIKGIVENSLALKILDLGSAYGDLHQLLTYFWVHHSGAIKKLDHIFDVIYPKTVRKGGLDKAWAKLTDEEKTKLEIGSIRKVLFDKNAELSRQGKKGGAKKLSHEQNIDLELAAAEIKAQETNHREPVEEIINKETSVGFSDDDEISEEEKQLFDDEEIKVVQTKKKDLYFNLDKELDAQSKDIISVDDESPSSVSSDEVDTDVDEPNPDDENDDSLESYEEVKTSETDVPPNPADDQNITDFNNEDYAYAKQSRLKSRQNISKMDFSETTEQYTPVRKPTVVNFGEDEEFSETESRQSKPKSTRKSAAKKSSDKQSFKGRRTLYPSVYQSSSKVQMPNEMVDPNLANLQYQQPMQSIQPQNHPMSRPVPNQMQNQSYDMGTTMQKYLSITQGNGGNALGASGQQMQSSAFQAMQMPQSRQPGQPQQHPQQHQGQPMRQSPLANYNYSHMYHQDPPPVQQPQSYHQQQYPGQPQMQPQMQPDQDPFFFQ